MRDSNARLMAPKAMSKFRSLLFGRARFFPLKWS